jgi:hypothetical protein
MEFVMKPVQKILLAGSSLVAGAILFAFTSGICTPFCLSVQLPPLPGYENVVDAVTQASNVIANISVDVTRPANPNDSILDVVIDYGDGVRKRWLNGTFQVDSGMVAVTHWYIRDSLTHGICTTKIFATTYGGDTVDTSIVIHVLADTELSATKPFISRYFDISASGPAKYAMFSSRGTASGIIIRRQTKPSSANRFYTLLGKPINKILY